MLCTLSLKKGTASRISSNSTLSKNKFVALLSKLFKTPRVKTLITEISISGSGPQSDRWPWPRSSFYLTTNSTRLLSRDKDEIRCFVLCRNENRRLPYFLKYYRKLGVDRFFIIDNGSSDGSKEFLSSQADVHLFETDDAFSKHRHGTNWLQALLQTYGTGYWCLTVDADELLVFPGSEELNLKGLRDFMEQENSQALFTMMIDMYPCSASAEREYSVGEPFLTVADHFDIGPYHVSIKPGRMFPPIKIRGGFQHRILQQENPKLKGPLLKKVPFVRWSANSCYGASTHGIIPAVALSKVSGALLHFKYLYSSQINFENEFYETRRRHNENKRISLLLEILEKTPSKDFKVAHSEIYENTNLLCKLGFLHCTTEYVKFLDHAHSKYGRGVHSEMQRELSKVAKTQQRGLALIYGKHIDSMQ